MTRSPNLTVGRTAPKLLPEMTTVCSLKFAVTLSISGGTGLGEPGPAAFAIYTNDVSPTKAKSVFVVKVSMFPTSGVYEQLFIQLQQRMDKCIRIFLLATSTPLSTTALDDLLPVPSLSTLR